MFVVSFIAVRLLFAGSLPLSTAPLIRKFFLSLLTNAQRARQRDHFFVRPHAIFPPTVDAVRRRFSRADEKRAGFGV
jgi:hypothetical protein